MALSKIVESGTSVRGLLLPVGVFLLKEFLILLERRSDMFLTTLLSLRFLSFIMPTVVLQILWWHVDVPGVPEHPPDQAEEDDESPCVDEQVVDNKSSKHPHHHDEDAEYVVEHCEPE
ncbi:hypothetical protein E3U43_012942 [Larimichthys crocea]|uniref:Uncharacterized protein n=1 Tax=Larimichthys crocea TaxID=215358 RepID=A0ACD3RTJ5_LARCR|nr:hypothetical protein E3U43_012942 [Larimichthys crocea]